MAILAAIFSRSRSSAGAAGVEKGVAEFAPVFAIGSQAVPIFAGADGAAEIGALINEFVDDFAEVGEILFFGAGVERTVGGGIGEMDGGLCEIGGIIKEHVGGFEVSVGAIGDFFDIDHAAHNAAEDVAKIVIVEIDAAIDERLHGALVAIKDGVGTAGGGIIDRT